MSDYLAINVRKNGEYLNIDITTFGFSKDLGLFDESEAETLLESLRDAVSDLEAYVIGGSNENS